MRKFVVTAISGRHRASTSEVKLPNSTVLGILDSILLVRLLGYVCLLVVCLHGISVGRIIDPIVLGLLLWLWGEFSSVMRRWYRNER